MPSSQISRTELVVRSACRRRLFVLSIEQLATTLALVLAGGVLILLLGTGLLGWYWLVLLALVGLALAFVRVRGQILAEYRVAQILDRRLQLSDSLSTAWFLLSQGSRLTDPLARFQIEHAEGIAASVRPARAFPFKTNRGWTVSASLAVVALGLFSVRYLVTSSLNLRQALVPVHPGAMIERVEKSLSAESHRPPDPALDQRQYRPQANAHEATEDRTDVSQAQNTDAGKPERETAVPPQHQSGNAHANGKQKDAPLESREGSLSSPDSNSGDKTDQPPGDETNPRQNPVTREQSAAAAQQTSSGLVDKMKDAFSSLVAKMRPNQNSERSQGGERTTEDQRAANQASASKSQRGQQPDTRNQQANQDQSSEGQAQGQTAEKSQASQGRSGDQSPEKGSEAHSGIGRQDGDKELKEAEQLQAMGKLAEIIGKRSASLTGDMMVETPSGKQQLKTAYSQRIGQHSDLGGEINRDEVPLIYQQYVREYMEQVRKLGKTGQ